MKHDSQPEACYVGLPLYGSLARKAKPGGNFADLEPPVRKKIQQAVAQSAPSAASVADIQSGSLGDPTMSILMEQS
jgi:hypothetical protein